MRIVMDSDCLIKITKARMKELVCRVYSIAIPRQVRAEVVDDAAGHPESAVVKENLENGNLTEAGGGAAIKGEEAVLTEFRRGGHDAVASDDKRFIRKLRVLGVPYLTPGSLVFLLVRDFHMTPAEGDKCLESLSPMVSDDELTVVRLKLAAIKAEGVRL